ncbi:hypothetical protein [Baekduia sp. Peel2402]|uniref:hypothetical protein n=1 Tax=Baekduia sp. Peel2402 TaxID=3458296 RepID=UPI00403E9931
MDRLIRASDLKRQRAWTDTLIVTLLGAPDALSPNPHGWRAPMRWYREDRVLDAEATAAFTARAERLDDAVAWRRDLPTRSFAPTEIEHLEWLDDPDRIALFHTPRRPRMRRPRRAAPAPPSAPAYEVLRLFDPTTLDHR